MATPSPEEREKTAQSSDEEKAHEPSAPRINQLEITSQEKEEHESDSNATGNQGALSSILTDRSALAAEDQREPQPPPDGGLLAWTQAATAHLLIANTWGFVNSFGVFQPYYVDVLGHAPSDISWIGSVQIFLLFAIGTFSGRALDAGFFRLVLIGGCLIHVFGIFMTSLSTKYWQVFLTQGICVGIGNGLLFCPTFSLVATYFAGRRSVAMGIAALGSATGGLVYPAVVQQLLPKIGFAWTVRVLGFIVLSTASLAIAFMKTRLPPRKAGALVELGAFKETSYLLFCIAMFLNFMGIYFTFYYIGAFGRDVIGLTYEKSLNLVLIINGAGYVGRIAPNILADRYVGAVNAIIPCAFFSGMLLFAWPGVNNQSGLIGFSVVYGIFSSGVQSMFAVALASLTPDLSKVGTRMGMCFSIVSIPTLIGPPIAGALISRRDGSYLYAQMWGGTLVITSTLVLIAARIAKTGLHLKRRT